MNSSVVGHRGRPAGWIRKHPGLIRSEDLRRAASQADLAKESDSKEKKGLGIVGVAPWLVDGSILRFDVDGLERLVAAGYLEALERIDSAYDTPEAELELDQKFARLQTMLQGKKLTIMEIREQQYNLYINVAVEMWEILVYWMEAIEALRRLKRYDLPETEIDWIKMICTPGLPGDCFSSLLGSLYAIRSFYMNELDELYLYGPAKKHFDINPEIASSTLYPLSQQQSRFSYAAGIDSILARVCSQEIREEEHYQFIHLSSEFEQVFWGTTPEEQQRAIVSQDLSNSIGRCTFAESLYLTVRHSISADVYRVVVARRLECTDHLRSRRKLLLDLSHLAKTYYKKWKFHWHFKKHHNAFYLLDVCCNHHLQCDVMHCLGNIRPGSDDHDLKFWSRARPAANFDMISTQGLPETTEDNPLFPLLKKIYRISVNEPGKLTGIAVERFKKHTLTTEHHKTLCFLLGETELPDGHVVAVEDLVKMVVALDFEFRIMGGTLFLFTTLDGSKPAFLLHTPLTRSDLFPAEVRAIGARMRSIFGWQIEDFEVSFSEEEAAPLPKEEGQLKEVATGGDDSTKKDDSTGDDFKQCPDVVPLQEREPSDVVDTQETVSLSPAQEEKHYTLDFSVQF